MSYELMTDNIMMFFGFAVPNAINCPWAFLISVSLSAGDAVLPDITNKIK